MKSFKTSFLLLFAFFSLAFIKPDYLEWSSTKKISYSDFKATPPKNRPAATAEIKTVISYQIQQEKGKVPKMTIINTFDRNASWIQRKNQGVLDLQQIKFDYSELYTRKIRKEMIAMNQKGIKSKEAYINVITKYSNQYERSVRRKNISLDDQPHLIKLAQKNVRDSLQLYHKFTK